MSAAGILAKIHRNRRRIRRFGVRRLGLFGSHARGSAERTSDLDFVVDLEKKSFDSYMGLKACLEELFHREVDLVLADAIKPRLRREILGHVKYAQGL